MSKQEFFTHSFPNGVRLLAESIPGVSSVSLGIAVSVGSAKDPRDNSGLSRLLCEMFYKGAGPYSAMELSSEFEKIGVERGHSCGTELSVFSASMLPEHLTRSLELLSLMLLKPSLSAEELPSVKELALQDIQALEDEPASKVMEVLSEQMYAFPFGRSNLGSALGIHNTEIEQIRQFAAETFVRQPIIISVAGRFEWANLLRDVEKFFAEWKVSDSPLSPPQLEAGNTSKHVQQDTQQIQIAFAYPSVTHGHPDYYVARLANAIMSGGMASRLFIEVREKLGLVYRVGASHSVGRGRGAIVAYAGTTPENGQKTLDVMLRELRRMSQGAEPAELARALVEVKSAVIMQSESSGARVAGLINDWWNLSRLRTIEEIRAGLEAVSNEDIKRHLSEYPVRNIKLVTLGSKSLELSNEVL